MKKLALAVGLSLFAMTFASGCSESASRSVGRSVLRSNQLDGGGNVAGTGTAIDSSGSSPMIEAAAECLSVCSSEPSSICNCEEAITLETFAAE